jgi:hypothetical protein
MVLLPRLIFVGPSPEERSPGTDVWQPPDLGGVDTAEEGFIRKKMTHKNRAFKAQKRDFNKMRI